MRALVLSGGGGFGAYQAGVWRALERLEWRPDLVVGASIGAVNGFVIARGGTSGDLMRVWRELPERVRSPVDNPGRLPVWGRTGQFKAWLREIVDEFGSRPLDRRLAVTMTELPGCAIRTVRDEEVGFDHLRASCALAGVVLPVRLNGAVYIDGGTFCRLPVRQALAAGATEIVAVDVLARVPCEALRGSLRAVVRVRNALRREHTEPTPEELTGARIHRVQHAQPLGTLGECFRWDPAVTERLIELGDQEATRVLSQAGAAARRRGINALNRRYALT